MSVRRSPSKSKKKSSSKKTKRSISVLEDDEIYIPYSQSKLKRQLSEDENEEFFGKVLKNQDKPFKIDPNDPRVIRSFRQVALLKDSTIIDEFTGKMILDKRGLSGATLEWGQPIAEFFHDNYSGELGEEKFTGNIGEFSKMHYDRATDIVNIHQTQLSNLKDPMYKYDDRVDFRLDRRGVVDGSTYEPYEREVGKRRGKGVTTSVRSIAGDKTRGKELRLFLDDSGRIRVETGNKWTFARHDRNVQKNPLNTTELRNDYALKFARERGEYLNYFLEGDATRLIQAWLTDPSKFDKIKHLTVSPEVAELLGFTDDNENGVLDVGDDFMQKTPKVRVINKVDRSDRDAMTWATEFTVLRDESGQPLKKNDLYQIQLTHNAGFNAHIKPLLRKLDIKSETGLLDEGEFHVLIDHLRNNNWEKLTKYGTRDAGVTIMKTDRELLGWDIDGTFDDEVREKSDKLIAVRTANLKGIAKKNQVFKDNNSPVRIRMAMTGQNGDLQFEISPRLNNYTGKKEDVVLVTGKMHADKSERGSTTFTELRERQNNYEGAMIKTKNDKYEGVLTLSIREAKKLLIDMQYANVSISSNIKSIGMTEDVMKKLDIDKTGDVKVSDDKLKQYKKYAKIRPDKDDEIAIVYHEDGYFEIRAKTDKIEKAVHKLIFDTFSYNVETWNSDAGEKQTIKRSLLDKHRRGGRLAYMLGAGKIDETEEKLEEAIGFKVKIYDPRPKAKRGKQVPLNIRELRPYQQIAIDEALTTGRGVVVMGTGGGKCTKFVTRVLTSQGMIQIGKLYSTSEDESTIPYIEGIETFNFESFMDGKSSHLYQKKQVPIIDINTQLGIELGATPHHRIIVLTKQGDLEWKYMRDIKIDDIVAIRYGSDMFPLESVYPNYNYHGLGITDNITIPSNMSNELAYIMGLLTGDGGLTAQHRIVYTNANSVMQQLYADTMHQLYNKSTRFTKRGVDQIVSSAYVKQHLTSLGLLPKKSYEKEVPFTVLSAKKEHQASFLKGLFDSDASVSRQRIEYSTSSEELAIDIQLMLLNFGIVSCKNMKKTYRKDHYVIRIYADFNQRYADEIGFNHPKKLKRLKELLEKKNNTNINLIPNIDRKLNELWKSIPIDVRKSHGMTGVDNNTFRSYFKGGKSYRKIPPHKLAQILDMMNMMDSSIDIDERFINLRVLTNGLFFTPVVSLEDDIDDVYDFVIPDTHSFVANGIINHNTVVSAGILGEFGKGNDVVFIAHNKFLLNQAQTELSKFLGVKVGSSVDFVPTKKSTWDGALVPSDQTKDTPKDKQKLNINVISVQSANRALTMDEAGFKFPKSEGAKRQMEEIREIMEGAEIIVLDETHHLKNKNTFQETLEKVQTQSKFGLTATPARTDDPKILQIHSVLGRELTDFDSSWLIDHNYLVPPEIYWVKAPTSAKAERINVDTIEDVVGKRISKKQKPLMVYQERVKAQIDSNEPRNNMIADIGFDLSEHGNTVLIFVEKIEHGKNLIKKLESKGMKVPFLNGEVVRDVRGNWKKSGTEAEKRNLKEIKRVKAGEVDLIVATNKIFGEGADVPKIDAIINAMGNKSSISTIQKVGRSIRLNPETDKKRAIVVEFEDEPIQNKLQGAHYKVRKTIYKNNSGFFQHPKTATWEEIKQVDDLKTTSKAKRIRGFE